MTIEVEDLSVEELTERAEADAGIGRFVAEAIGAHCDSDQHAMQFLTSLLINMSVNQMICPHCMEDMFSAAVEGVFERVEDADGNHKPKMRMADEISEIIKEGETSH